ncbi:hypothetical protein ACLKMY_39295 [Paraburkholderia mimosarum]|uniref:hypothetical protein n=1 Tax=Paraburkholderia mimosarum TaxID=312026 RepID=UPI00041D19D8|nr:hypothetical protein [Paraburkholderia mimosarum]
MSTATASGQALKSAADAVEVSGETTIKQLDAAITVYLHFPELIMTTAHAIEGAAMAGGTRSLDYSSLVQNLKAAQSSQGAASDAKTQVQGANAQAGSATAAASAAGAAQVQKLNSPGGVTVTLSLDAAAAAAAGVASAAVPPAQPAGIAAPDTTPALDAAGKQDALASVLTSPAYNDMTRVSVLSASALDDLPSPDFSTTAVNIQACWPVN